MTECPCDECEGCEFYHHIPLNSVPCTCVKEDGIYKIIDYFQQEQVSGYNITDITNTLEKRINVSDRYVKKEDMIAELPLVKRPEAPCKTQFPLYSDKDKKPIWLDTTGLMKKVIHCEGPQFPPACKKSTN